jgi:hypothetical protein
LKFSSLESIVVLWRGDPHAYQDLPDWNGFSVVDPQHVCHAARRLAARSANIPRADDIVRDTDTSGGLLR